MLLKKKFFLILLSLSIVFCVVFYLITSKESKISNKENITLNFKLITSVHPDLNWSFDAASKEKKITIGDVTTLEYVVKNLGDKKTSGSATFSYYPKEISKYFSKINCFCYETQTLLPGEEASYTLVFLIDPKVTKDSKTKNINEAIIQFTFFKK